jgi:hypothetical protein
MKPGNNYGFEMDGIGWTYPVRSSALRGTAYAPTAEDSPAWSAAIAFSAYV